VTSGIVTQCPVERGLRSCSTRLICAHRTTCCLPLPPAGGWGR